MKRGYLVLALLCSALLVPIISGADVPVAGPSAYSFTTSGQSHVWSCYSGQSSFALTVPSGLTGTFTVTVSQTSGGTYVNPPWSYAPGVSTYTNTITNSGSLTVNLGSNAYVKVADTSYSSGSVTVTGVCSAAVGVIPPGMTAVTGTNPIVVTSPSPGTVNVAVSPNPQFSGGINGTIIGDTGSSIFLSGDVNTCNNGAVLGNYCIGDDNNGGILFFDRDSGGSSLWTTSNSEFTFNGGVDLANVVSFDAGSSINSGACTVGVPFSSGVTIYSSTGVPTCTASTGSLYLRSDGAVGSQLYVSAGSGAWYSAGSVLNASVTPSPAPTGYSGPVVVAQATALPTIQPGNIAVSGKIVAGGSIVGGSATAPTCTAGDGCFSRSTTTGALDLGGSSSSCALDYGVTNSFATVHCALFSTGGFTTPGTSGNISTNQAQTAAFCPASAICSSSGASSGLMYIGGGTSHCELDYGITTAGTDTFGCPVVATSFNGKKPSEVSCTDSSVGVITCSATVAYTSTTSYACGMSVTLPTTTTGTATGQYVVNTSATSVTGTVPGLSVATGTATLNFNCLGT